jgi:hypothetical protein
MACQASAVTRETNTAGHERAGAGDGRGGAIALKDGAISRVQHSGTR